MTGLNLDIKLLNFDLNNFSNLARNLNILARWALLEAIPNPNPNQP